MRTSSTALILAALIAGPVAGQERPDPQALAQLCQRGIEAEQAIPGGAAIVWRQWVRKARPSPEAQAVQLAFCERYFLAYDRARNQRRTRQ